MPSIRDAKVADLSIANRQLVAICRAMAADARLVIMDEPTASLTRHEVDALLALVRELKAKGIAIMFVSHQPQRGDGGRRARHRAPRRQQGRHLRRPRRWTTSSLGLLMTGKEFAYEPQGDPAAGKAARRPCGRAISSRAGEYEDVSFEVHAGEILGITGLLGSGRTELALSLFGMTRPDSGAIRIGGRPVRFRSNREAVEHGIAYVPEDRLTLGLVLEQPIAPTSSSPSSTSSPGRSA